MRPVSGLCGKMVHHDGPDDPDDGCGDDDSHERGPEQPNLLQNYIVFAFNKIFIQSKEQHLISILICLAPEDD